ncbi:MAG TPA: hypothetical protein VKK79_25540 [Candidatus Lokiarchaeia archaeon]|nr:hypothetical protein [Candidatus Lokiarchaeia archaeon]
MSLKVKDLTVEQLQSIIRQAVEQTLEDLKEDIEGLASQRYLRSIEEARGDYREGRTQTLEDVLNG